MAKVTDNSVKNVLTESTPRTKEGNNACSEKSIIVIDIVESCDNKSVNIVSSNCEKNDMTNKKQKTSELAPSQSENKKERDRINKEKNTQSNKKDINKKDKRLGISKESKRDKYPEKNSKSSRRFSKSPIRRCNSPRYDRRPRRSPARYGGYSRSPMRRSLSPRRYDRPPESNTFLSRKNHSPIPSIFQYKGTDYKHPRRSVLSPQRYDTSPERCRISPKRDWSPISDGILECSELPKEGSRSSICFNDKKKDRDIHEQHKSFSLKNNKNKKQAKLMSVMQTGLVPPGMEAEFDLSILPQPNRTAEKNIGRNLPTRKKKELGRRSFSPARSKSIRSKEILGTPKTSKNKLNPYSKESCSPKTRVSPNKRKYECFLDEIEDIFVEKGKQFSENDKFMKQNTKLLSEENKFVEKKESLFRENAVSGKKESFSRNKFVDKTRKKSMEKRKSFLEEIEEKLQLKQSNVNTTRNKPSTPLELQNNTNKQLHFPGSSPVSQVNLNTVMQPGISHQLFSNQPQMKPHNLPQSVGQHGFLQQDAYHMPQHMSLAMQHIQQPVPAPFLSQPINHPVLNTQLSSHTITQNRNQNEKEIFAKLLADKKTTLNECIRLGPTTTDTPINIQNKIYVISRCQEAIKVLGKNLKTDGRLLLKTPQKKSEKPTEIKGMCPFKRLRVTRFHFTSQQSGEDKPPLTVFLDRFLVKLGQKSVSDVSTQDAAITDHSPYASHPKNQHASLVEEKSTVIKKTTASISTQTEDISCSECIIRKNIHKSCTYTQTDEAPLSFDISCQVNTEELKTPIRGILKKQALSILSSEELLSNQNTQQLGDSSFTNNYNTNVRNTYTSDRDYSGPKRQRLNEHGFEVLDEDINRRSHDYSDIVVNPYGDRSNSYSHESDLRDKINSLTRRFSEEKTTFPKPFPSKSIPFGNFDHKLNLNFSKSLTSTKRDIPRKLPYDNSAPSTENYWNKRY